MNSREKIIIIILIVILMVGIIAFIIFNTAKNNNILLKDNINEVVLGKEIEIYDIEEGYLKVPYNYSAEINEYKFNEFLENNNGYYTYEDENYKSKLGIDVSSYQGNIDWKKVKQEGIEFAILRLGYRGYGQSGKIVLDSKFEENYKKAKEQGIEIGVYFFSQAINIEEVKEEAEFVLKNLDKKQITYPVVFDLEKIKNDKARTDNLSVEEITNMTLEFCKVIKENGYESSIYGNAKTFTTKMKLELFNDYNKWYADYQEKPLYPYEFNLWQYTETGKVNGITGKVDLDIEFVKK